MRRIFAAVVLVTVVLLASTTWASQDDDRLNALFDRLKTVTSSVCGGAR